MQRDRIPSPLNIPIAGSGKKPTNFHFTSCDNSSFIENAFKPTKFWIVLSGMLLLISFVLFVQDEVVESDIAMVFILVFLLSTVLLFIKYRKDSNFYRIHHKIVMFLELQPMGMYKMDEILRMFGYKLNHAEISKIFYTLKQLPQYDIDSTGNNIIKRMQ